MAFALKQVITILSRVRLDLRKGNAEIIYLKFKYDEKALEDNSRLYPLRGNLRN